MVIRRERVRLRVPCSRMMPMIFSISGLSESIPILFATSSTLICLMASMFASSANLCACSSGSPNSTKRFFVELFTTKISAPVLPLSGRLEASQRAGLRGFEPLAFGLKARRSTSRNTSPWLSGPPADRGIQKGYAMEYACEKLFHATATNA